jgi:hypothetical protein
MQEKILSKKLLIFTDAQVYWSCWNAVWLEEVVLEDATNIMFARRPASTGPFDDGFSSLENATKTVYGLYSSLVNAYLKRRLSFQSDILNAFSGICQALGVIGDDTFHWGLPVSRFETALCWELVSGGTRNYAVSNTNSVQFSSWSWTSWHGSSPSNAITWLTAGYDSDWRDPEASDIIFYRQDSQGHVQKVTQDFSKTSGVEAITPEDH